MKEYFYSLVIYKNSHYVQVGSSKDKLESTTREVVSSDVVQPLNVHRGSVQAVSVSEAISKVCDLYWLESGEDCEDCDD